MNKHALYHKSESEYCFPIDEHNVLIRFRTARQDNDIASITLVYNMCAYFPRKQKRMEMKLAKQDSLFDYYEATLSSDIPSFMYLFEIRLNDGKKCYYDEFGYQDNIALIDCGTRAFRVPFVNSKNILKVNEKFEGDVVYQIFPERFNLGNHNKDKSYITRDWNSKDMRGNQFNRNVFLGGDLQGIIAKLDYIKDLGVDIIYMTPINKSSSNHKYNVEDYYKIDEHFGDDETFKNLVDLAHEKGLKIVMDLVFNHSSKDHPFFQDVLAKGKESKYYNFYCMQDKPLKTDNLNYYSFNSCGYMPKLNSNNPEVQDYFAKVGEYYLNKFHVDGFRLDVANEVSHDFWINFNKRVKAIDPNCIIIGENWDNAHRFLRNIEFDGVMNYQFFTVCWDFFIHHRLTAPDFTGNLNWLLTRYEDSANRNSFTLIDSHDTGRFYNFCKGNKDIYLLGLLTQISYVGLPMIYYGDEIFMMGGADPDNRRGMAWNSEEFNSSYHQLFKDIVKLRKLKAFRSGDINIKEDNGLIYIDRFNKMSSYTVIMNNNNETKEVIADTVILSNRFNNNTLGAFGFAVIKNK